MNTAASPFFSAWTQIQLIAWLRWRLLLAMLRAPGAKAELIARLCVTVAAVLITGTIAVTVGMLSNFLMHTQPQIIGRVFWGIFLIGQFLPVIVSANHTSFDTRTLLRFPLRFRAFLILALSYSVFDPAALSALLWLSSAGVGAALARPSAAHWIAAAVLLLATVSLLLNRLALSWAEKLLARRRSREILFIVFIFAMLSVQVFGAASHRWRNELAPIAAAASPYLGVLPPGLAGSVISTSNAAGRSEAMLLGVLALYAFLLFWLLRKRMLAQYRGEELSETVVVQTKEKHAPRSAGRDFAVPLLGNQRAALVGKELRYLVRNAVTMLQLGIPFFLITFFGLLMDHGGKELGFFQRNPDTVLPSAMGYAILIGMPMAHNALSFESRGIQLLLMAPVRFRDVFLAKNLALGFAIFLQAGLVSLMVHFLFGAQQLVIIAATLMAVLFLLLANFSVGNLLSLYFPRAFNFNSFQQRQSPWSVIAAMLIQIVGMGMVYLVYALAAWWGNRWLAVGALAIMSAAMSQVYLLVLDRCDDLAQQRREILVTEICRHS